MVWVHVVAASLSTALIMACSTMFNEIFSLSLSSVLPWTPPEFHSHRGGVLLWRPSQTCPPAWLPREREQSDPRGLLAARPAGRRGRERGNLNNKYYRENIKLEGKARNENKTVQCFVWGGGETCGDWSGWDSWNCKDKKQLFPFKYTNTCVLCAIIKLRTTQNFNSTLLGR